MATVLSTLYPPLIDTFMPAFPNTTDIGAPVHFTVSPYNSSYEIQYLHVTLVDQKTNKNAFATEGGAPDGTALVNGVWIIPFTETLNGNTNPYLEMDRDANYYTLYIPRILLKGNDNEERYFLVNNYYKVQLRFDKYIESNSDSTTLVTWNSDYLAEKRAFFSEWSSVCLLKAIPTITLHLNNFTIELDNYLRTTGTSITNLPSNFVVPVRTPQYMPGIIPFAGNLTFEGDNDSGIDKYAGTEYYRRDIRTTSNSEYIMSYRIKVFDNLENLIKDSGTLYPARAEKTNNFYWLCDLTSAATDITYSVELTFTTNNQYTFSKTFNFILIEPSNLEFNPIFKFNKIELPYNGLGHAWKRADDDYFANWSTFDLSKLNSEVREDGVWYEVEDEKVLVTCEDGWVTLTISHGELITPGYLFIKRATSLDNFQNWELIDCSHVLYSDNFSRTIVDKTVSSLVSYKYSAQYLTSKGSWTRTVISPEIVYPDFHDILISRGDRQLAIRYNAQIASMTPVVNRVKIDTLGGRYPKFAENAKLHYKQFQLSGLIIAESDYNRKFLNDLNYRNEMAIYDERMNGAYAIRNDTIKETGEITIEYETEKGDIESHTYSNGTYSQDIESADTYIQKRKRDTQKNTNHDLYPMDNWWWERKFREEAMEWLNDGEPKLYRSMPEGNLIVMIDSVSLTPNTQLGRRVWNFSATLYEVGDGNSLQELDALGIYPIVNTYGGNFEGTYSINADTTINKQQLGQTFHITAAESNGTTLVTANDIAKASISYANNDGIIMDHVPVTTIGEDIGNLYQGLYGNYDFNSATVRLKDLKIQFESLPQWYDLTAITPQGTVPGTLFFTIVDEEEGKEYEVYLERDGEEWKVKKVSELISGKLWDLAGQSITDFFNEWENTIAKNTSGNNLFKVNLDSGESILVNGNDLGAIDKIVDAAVRDKNEKLNYGLGYKLKLNLVSPYDSNVQLERVIFVNEKGYYQVPSNLSVKEITLYDGATATLDYILEYDLNYNDETEPNSYEAAENIVGQVSGEWDWNTSIAPIIQAKYFAHDKDSNNAITEQMVDYWKAISFDGTPYTILNIKSTSDLASTRYIVGRSGVLNLQTDYPTDALYVNGKRMIQAPISRQKYLDEWEYVIDGSVYEALNYHGEDNSGSQYWYVVYENIGANISDWVSSDEIGEGIPVIIYLSENVSDLSTARDIIDGWYELGDTSSITKVEYLEPMPNTVYAIANTAGGFDYKIYYLDEGWFNIEFPNIADKDLSIAHAHVPVYGMIEYRATIMKKFWDPTA